MEQLPQEVIEQLTRIPHLAQTVRLLEDEVSAHRADKAMLMVELEQASYQNNSLSQELDALRPEAPTEEAPEVPEAPTEEAPEVPEAPTEEAPKEPTEAAPEE